MKIVLCDDEASCNETLKKLIELYMFNRNLEITVDCFTSGYRLLECEKYDLYFLDFIMPEISGVDLAVKLREKFNNTVTVCFLTSFEKAAIEVINKNVYAEAFLLKPVDRDRLFELLDRLYGQSLFSRLILTKDKKSRAVYSQDIIYVEASRKNTVFHFFDSSEEYPYSITDIENMHLPVNLFCKVHRSYIVNLMHVDSFSKTDVIMKNGDIIPLRREKEFKSAYSDFNLSYVR